MKLTIMKETVQIEEQEVENAFTSLIIYLHLEVHCFPIASIQDFEVRLKSLNILPIPDNSFIAVGVTGGGSVRFARQIQYWFPNCRFYDEITCITQGFLSQPGWTNSSENSVIIANVGTGASFIKVNPKDGCFERIGGTNLGGSVINGLFKWHRKDFSAVELSINGQHKRVDTLVSHIYGADYDRGGLKGELVAGSLGKLTAQSAEEDVVAGILFMIASNLAHLLSLYASIHGIDQIVLAGTLSSLPGFQSAFKEAMQYYNQQGKLSFHFHPQSPYLGCLGIIDDLEKKHENRLQ